MTASQTANQDEPFSVEAALKAMPEADKKALQGWYWYDWGNQAYALTVMTVIAPALMANLYNLATGTQSGDAFYAYILTISMLLVVVTAPALGVIADRMPIKKKLLKWYTTVGVIFTALMGAAPYFGAYGFMGGSLLLIFHLIILMGPFSWDTNFRLAAIFVSSSLWWWGYGFLMFKWTPEPEIPSHMEWQGVVHATKVAYAQVGRTFMEIKKFKVLALFLLAYLLFYDGVNTIASMASAFGESVLRLNPAMNIFLLLTVNIVAIPMTLLFGKLANVKGTKFALMLSLLIYSAVAVVAAGFSPLEMEQENAVDDVERYDFQFTWVEPTEGDPYYQLDTLYDRGYEGWIGESSEGDDAFRTAFESNFPTPDYSVEDAGSSTLGAGILVCLFILILLGLLGGAMVYIQGMELGFKGALLIMLVVLIGLVGASMLADEAKTTEEEIKKITATNAAAIVSEFDMKEHRFSIVFVGGPEDGMATVGDTHPSVVDQGGPVDGYATFMRDNLWSPLGIGVSMQWIILGLFVGIAMGAAGAQARSMFSMLIPETRTSEFFGFFGFLGKSAAMIGTFLYGIASSTFDSRVAILTITIVILAGTYLTSRVDLEEGIRVAAEEDRIARGEAPSSVAINPAE